MGAAPRPSRVLPPTTKRGTVALTDQVPPAQRSAAPAAHAVELRKTYGTGQATVHALAGIDVTFERGRFTAVMGPSGSGKSTLMHCMAGLDRPTSGQTLRGRPRHREPRRQGADPAAARPHRLRVPVVQPRAHADRRREHHPAGRPGGEEGGPGVVRLPRRRQLGIARPAVAPAHRAVGRPAAALRLRPGPDQPARPDLRRRAHGQPGLELLGRDAVVPAAVGERVRPVHRHGHPRPPRGVRTRTGSSSWPTARSSTSWPTRRRTRSWSASGRWAPDMWRVTIKGLLAHKLRLALDRAGHRPRGDVHRRDVRPDRHPAQHVRQPLRQHLPARRLPGARRGPVRERRHRHPQPRPRVAPRQGAGGPRRGGRQRLGDRLRAVHRPRRQGRHHRRGTHPRGRVRPQPGDLRAPHRVGPAADDAQRRRHGPRHGAEVRLQGRREGAHPPAGPDPHLHHQRPDTLRHGEQPGRGDAGRLRRPDRAGASWATSASSTTSTSSAHPVRTRPSSSTTSRGCCPTASRW